MKKIKAIALAALLLGSAMTMNAKQPYGGCWHPKDIKEWSPETDPDAKFNRSRVPLAERFIEPTIMKANANQYYEGQVCNATILFNICSSCPSQGAYNFLGYQPTYWQYMDKLVYWAGSASEGIIIPPPAGSIDAAHAQGVKVLGQIFFPPTAYGGTQEWVRQMVSKENGKYIYAVKLYEIAKYLGFDGWFINEETGGASTDEWVGFIQEFNNIADTNGDTQMEIQWYNASGYPNTTILRSHKNTSQFLEYGSPGDYRGQASALGCTEAETFSKIYGGIQCVSSGLTGYNYYLNRAFPTTGHVGSVDLFCPEENAWKKNVEKILGTSDETGEKAYEAIIKTFENEEKAWVNLAGDPANTNGTWRGISGCVAERSVITSMPFVSDMNVGVGKHRFVRGKSEGTRDWYHSGMQSILPTWRWWIENRGDIKVNINWDDAFNGASSFTFSDIPSGDRLVRLYKTQVPVESGAILRLVYKGTAPAIKLSTTSSVNPDITLTPSKTTQVNGWRQSDYALSSIAGKTIYMIGMMINGATNNSLTIGRIALLPASNYAPEATEIRNAKIEANLGETDGDIRLTWDFDWSEDFDHFDIYIERADGSRELMGQTRDEAFYLPSLPRLNNDLSVKVELKAVMKDGKQGPATTFNPRYPAPTAPKVSFKLSKSYLKVGETATVTAYGTGNPTAWEWVLPEGLSLASGKLTDQTITVRANTIGEQHVTVKATNSIGTSTTPVELIDVYDEAGYASVTNVVLHKTVVDYSGSANEREIPDNLIDGLQRPTTVSSKWCNVSPTNWVIFDCQGKFRFYGFKIFDCKSGIENNENIRNYTIELSEDGENWVTVVDEIDRQDDNIKEDYIVPTTGRYIRFSPTVAGVLRVWEFEAYGVDDTSMQIKADTEEFTLNGTASRNITVTYDLNGSARQSNFACTATASNDDVTIGDIAENATAKTFTVPVTGKDVISHTAVVIRVTNGTSYKEVYVNVTLDSDRYPNLLSGSTARIRSFKADYSYEAPYEESFVTTLTNGDHQSEGLMHIEDYSIHTDDCWAIFECNGTWDISKVRIHIPEENYGENDNGNMGHVNRDITIAVGDDLNSMERIYTFNDLEKVSTLEHILPSVRNTSKLAIICNLNAYHYPSLAEVEAFGVQSGISEVTVEANQVVGIYDLSGRKVENLANGFYIIRYSNGTSSKVLLK